MARRQALMWPALVLVLAVAAMVAFGQRNARLARVDAPAPGFTLPDLEGRPVSLDQFRGKVVFINFWASWCDPCKAETPALEAFHRRYGDQVVLLGVNQREPLHLIRRYQQEYGISYRILWDANGQVAKRYGLKALPESWFIDSQGVARVYWVGPMTFQDMVAALAKVRAAEASAAAGSGWTPQPREAPPASPLTPER